MIEVRRLGKHYPDLLTGRTVALHEASFSARGGEILAVLGANGAGKTTLLRILSTVLQPTSGTASIDGWDVVDCADEARRRLGFVSAGAGVYDRMTAWESVVFFGRLAGLSGDRLRERAEAVFAQLQMNDLRDVLAARMSTGMRQKVSIARAIVHDPAVVIFDEATSGLDVIAARGLLETVVLLRDAGKCVLYSTHIMREVEKLADRAVIFHRGRLLADGPLEELRDRHDERDLEELFFHLIRQEPAAVASGAA